MKNLFYMSLLFISVFSNAQIFELKNQQLRKYYELINTAENKIIDGQYKKAFHFYKKAFKINKEPNAKDLYNSLKVAQKIDEKAFVKKQYHKLKCLKFKYLDELKVAENLKVNNAKCENTIDENYRKKLDSLVKIDQHCRKISKGDYDEYKREIGKSDSICPLNLLELIKEKGFPNEYNIGLASSNKSFFQGFYYVIWHQLKTQSTGKQQVDFYEEIIKALNQGKISPELSAFLFDLNTGINQFNSIMFIHQFVRSNGSSTPIYEQVKNKTAIFDCCYAYKMMFPKTRNETDKKRIQILDENRKKIGLYSIDDDIRKKFFYLKNREFMFPEARIQEHHFQKESDINLFKEDLQKIK